MDLGSDILSSLKLNVCSYVSQKCSSHKCKLVSCHTSNLSNSGDLSFPVNIKAWKGHILVDIPQSKQPSSLSGGDGVNVGRDVNNTFEILSVVQLLSRRLRESGPCCNVIGDTEREEEIVIQDLIHRSRSWPLVLRRCTLQKERFVMYINRALAFKTGLHRILSQRQAYGCGEKKSQKVVITSDQTNEDVESLDLTQYRVQIVKEVFSKLLTTAGYELTSEDDKEKCLHFHVTSRHMCDLPPDCVRVLCSVILNRKQRTKEKDILVRDYLRLRSKDVEACPSSNADDDREADRAKLTRVGLRAEIVSVRPSQHVSLDLQPGDGNNKAVPILYTCARIAVLLKRFEELVAEGVYPPLVPIEEVDFSLLVKEEEWQLLYGCLLVYPSLLQESMEHIKTAQPQPHSLYHFLVILCRHYSIYYNFVRIFVKPEKQVLGTLYARLYLLKAIQCVLHNALNILGIEPVTKM